MNPLTSKKNILIQNVTLLDAENQREHASVLICDGVLEKVVENKENCEVPADCTLIDGTGKLLVSAGVDPQVHLRVPGQPEKETARSGLDAAVIGGMAALLTMPNTKPVIDDLDVLAKAKEELDPASKATGVKVLISAAITKGQRGKETVDFSELAKAGVAAFTDDGVGVMSDEIMKQAFRASADTGLAILQHAEMLGHGGVLHQSQVQQALGVKAYPSAAESEMVERDLRLLSDYPGARYHVLHVSAKETLAAVSRAKEKGLAVTCEVSPHHLYFSCDDINPEQPSFKMNPPLRSHEDRKALRQALRDGLCDFVATDHAPHEPEAKTLKFATSAYGTTGLETSLRVLLSLVHQGELSLKRLAEVFSKAPATFLGLDHLAQGFKVGENFYGVLVDWKKPVEVTLEQLKSQSKNNCFLGTTLNGDIEAVIFADRSWSILDK